MKKAGITHPETKAGIKFCTNSCPYECCIVFEAEAAKKAKARGIQRVAYMLYNKGVTVDDLSAIFSRGTDSIRKYIKRERLAQKNKA